MKKIIEDGGPAFPQPENCHGRIIGGQVTLVTAGMSLRDWFAATAPFTLADAKELYGDAHQSIGPDDHRTAILAVFALLRYEYADHMMAERSCGGAS